MSLLTCLHAFRPQQLAPLLRSTRPALGEPLGSQPEYDPAVSGAPPIRLPAPVTIRGGVVSVIGQDGKHYFFRCSDLVEGTPPLVARAHVAFLAMTKSPRGRRARHAPHVCLMCRRDSDSPGASSRA